MDRRLAARVDSSNLVQESLLDADHKLDNYLPNQPLPFYLWLCQLTLERLAQVHRRHLRTQKGAVQFAERPLASLADDSMDELALRLAARGSSPSVRLARAEGRDRLRAALAWLPEWNSGDRS